MSKSSNMLRTRRRDNNVKPNRRDSRLTRLDRKSSRGMIYENEELRLRTININAEIERGQYDIKKLKRENEMLKKEIWSLRDEYEKLDKLLKDKEYDFSSSSSTTCSSDSDSCSSCPEDCDAVETSQNLENVQKTNMKNLHTEFDHLSVVPEENSTEISDRTSSLSPNDQYNQENDENNIIKPDQSYPQPTFNFFSPLKMAACYHNDDKPENNGDFVATMAKTSPDLIVTGASIDPPSVPTSSFSNGGNLDELLHDIETISQDILKITNEQDGNSASKPFKSELNVVLMPNPMPLLGFDKYRSIDTPESIPIPPPLPQNPFYFADLNDTEFNNRYVPDQSESKTNLLEVTSSELVSSENEENIKFQTSESKKSAESKPDKLSIRRKVSIHFKGKKDKLLGAGSIESKKSIVDIDSKKSDIDSKTPTSSGSDHRKSVAMPLAAPRKSVSISPERRKSKKHKKHRKSETRAGIVANLGFGRIRRPSSTDRLHRERSFSIASAFVEHREDSESMSSCETVKTRKMSSLSNIPIGGKVPWCACWGNGCV